MSERCTCREAICPHNSDWDLATVLAKNKKLERQNAELLMALEKIARVAASVRIDKTILYIASKAIASVEGKV